MPERDLHFRPANPSNRSNLYRPRRSMDIMLSTKSSRTIAATKPALTQSVAPQPIPLPAAPPQNLFAPRPVVPVPKKLSAAKTAVKLPVHPRQDRSKVLQRRAVQKSAQIIQKKTRSRHYVREAYVIFALSALLFLAGTYTTVMTLTGNLSSLDGTSLNAETFVEERDGGTVLVGAQPNEKIPPLDLYKNYTTAGDVPKYLQISALNVTARIKTLESNGTSIPFTNNIFDAGWVSSSAKPGKPGVSIINGYQSGPTKEGLMKQVTQAKQGMVIRIVTGDNQIQNYEIVNIETTAKPDLDPDDFEASTPTAKELALVARQFTLPGQPLSYVIVTAIQK